MGEYRGGEPIPRGWKFTFSGTDKKGRPRNGKLYVRGVPGLIPVRGRIPALGVIVSSDMCWREGRWWLSLVVEISRERRGGAGHCTIDLDLMTEFARVAADRADGECVSGQSGAESNNPDCQMNPPFQGDASEPVGETPETGANRRPAHLQEHVGPVGETPETGANGKQPALWWPVDPARLSHEAERVAELQRKMDRCRRGSWRYRALRRRKAVIQARAARRRREMLHLWTTRNVATFGDITVIAPASIKEATKSGRGDERDPGAEVDLKAKINRRALDFAGASAVNMLVYKSAEARIRCDVIRSEDHPLYVGNALVEAAKSVRRADRSTKKRSPTKPKQRREELSR
jgi:hypothetical protein